MLQIDQLPTSSDVRPAAVRLTRADALIAAALALLTLAVSLYFAPRGFHHGFVDIGHDGYQLREVLDLAGGGVVFRDTFDQYGPLGGYLNTIGFLTLGRRLLAIKQFIAGWYAVTAVVLFVIARQWLRRGLAAFSVLAWLGLAPFANHGVMISPQAYALLFQAVGMLIAVRTADFRAARFLTIGLLAGLSWAVKQSVGVLFLAAIVAWLLVRLVRPTAPRAGVWAATAAVCAGFAAVVGASLALLYVNGAAGDWYLQTIAFPRQFYLSGPPVYGLLDVLSPLLEQFTQPLYWILIRVVVLLAPFIVRRRGPIREDHAWMMACTTGVLWLGAYPSVNFMHQWWAASLTFAPLVVCLREIIARWTRAQAVVPVATVIVVSAVIASGVRERIAASRARAQTLTETLAAPPLFSGIRTDAATASAFDTLYRTMTQYRAVNAGVRIESIETADGWGNGRIETLPLLSFFDDNTHPHPVYWSLPLLATSVYPDYTPNLWRRVRERRPLLVDHRAGTNRPFSICGYRVLITVRSDVGHWYVYAPTASASDAEQPAAMDFICADDGSGPTLPRARLANLAGAWRGTITPSHHGNEPFRLNASFPLELNDPAIRGVDRPVNVYTWPPRVASIDLDEHIEAVGTNVSWREGAGKDIVKDLRPGAWAVDGSAARPFSYLLQWEEEAIEPGTLFLARGELDEGGLLIGFLEHGKWLGQIVANREGPFEAVFKFEESGRYGLVLANYLDSSWSERWNRHPFPASLGLLGRGFFLNRFRVTQAGWVRPRAQVTAG